MPKKKEAKKEKVPVKKERTITPRKSPYTFPSLGTSDLWRSFDDAFARFRSDFEDLFFPSPWADIFPAIPTVRTPLVDLEDQGKNFLLKAEMPGFKKEDIKIDVREDQVSVSAEVGWKYDKKQEEYICKERECRSFYRSIQLPEEVDVEKVTAELSDGLLEINLPKQKPKKTRKVKIK
jgi:HSP20 family protein